ncbi:MAG: hypothetical protein M1825_000587 [Sarcosagium campestre]|nr:MAG: hypothetical protein M1825_000587 [Sarcosagium campestre]
MSQQNESVRDIGASDRKNSVQGATHDSHTGLGIEKAQSSALEKRELRRRLRVKTYKPLLDYEVQCLETKAPKNVFPKLQSSRIGLSLWSSGEKIRFFRALQTRGRCDIRGIAKSIGTKSTLEVEAYQKLLHRGLFDRYRLQRGVVQEFDVYTIPAAAEVSASCCEAVGRAATHLETRDTNHIAQQEEVKWKETWLLDPLIARKIKEELDRLHPTPPDLLIKVPEASLLDLEKCLWVSERIFMNRAIPDMEQNWSSLAKDQEMPSIHHSAFVEFHDIATSITRRLVQSCIYFAESRIRAQSRRARTQFKVDRNLRREDVHAACRVMGLPETSHEFWTGSARRCGLQVIDNRPAKGEKFNWVTIDCDEVEQLLSGTYERDEGSSSPSDESPDESETETETPIILGEPGKTQELDDSSSDVSAPQAIDPGRMKESGDASQMAPVASSESGDDGTASDDVESEQHEGEEEDPDRDEDATEMAHEAYGEALDRRSSMVEEKRLWAVLRTMPKIALEETTIDLPRKPRRFMKSEVDWRDTVEYWAAWEKFDFSAKDFKFSSGDTSLEEKEGEEAHINLIDDDDVEMADVEVLHDVGRNPAAATASTTATAATVFAASAASTATAESAATTVQPARPRKERPEEDLPAFLAFNPDIDDDDDDDDDDHSMQ